MNLHEAAVAGLASREDFKSVILRKTKKAADGTAIDEEMEDPSSQPSLVVVQIKGNLSALGGSVELMFCLSRRASTHSSDAGRTEF